MTEQVTYEFDKVYEENKVKVTNLARQKIRDKGRVADVVQEVFGVLYENLIANNPIQNISAWLVGVTRNKVRESIRKDAKYATESIVYSGSSGSDEEAPLFLHDILPDVKGLADSDLFNDFIKVELEKAIDELPEEQQWVFVQHELEDKSFKDMEAETGVPLKTLLSRKHYAVKALQKKLREVYEEYKK